MRLRRSCEVDDEVNGRSRHMSRLRHWAPSCACISVDETTDCSAAVSVKKGAKQRQRTEQSTTNSAHTLNQQTSARSDFVRLVTIHRRSAVPATVPERRCGREQRAAEHSGASTHAGSSAREQASSSAHPSSNRPRTRHSRLLSIVPASDRLVSVSAHPLTRLPPSLADQSHSSQQCAEHVAAVDGGLMSGLEV